LSTVNDRSHPIRSAITVAGKSGRSANSDRIAGSTASTIDPLAGREYTGGLSRANARRTAFRDTPKRRAITLMGIASTRRNLRISAQSSTANILLVSRPGGPFSAVARGSVFRRRRHQHRR
jgi:hypothetical protein